MLETFRNSTYFMNSGEAYIKALLVFLVSLVVLKIFQVTVVAWLKKLSKKTETDLDDLLVTMFDRLKPAFYVTVSIYFALQFLNFYGWVEKVVNGAIILVLVYYATSIVIAAINYGTRKALSHSVHGEESDPTALKTIQSLLKMIVWVLAAVLILSNLGVNVSSLIAGLGIGGLALAFAFQNILEDIFSSFSILIDKPLRVGDFIKVGSDMGTVEKVGIKTTRLKTPQGEELVISNRELTSTRINNFGRLDRRRNLFSVGVTYETPQEKLEKIPSLIEDAVKGIEGVTFDRAHFSEFGASSLDFEIVYHAESSDYNYFMDIQHAVKFAIKKAFDKEGIVFAYPTQTIFVEK